MLKNAQGRTLLKVRKWTKPFIGSRAKARSQARREVETRDKQSTKMNEVTPIEDNSSEPYEQELPLNNQPTSEPDFHTDVQST